MRLDLMTVVGILAGMAVVIAGIATSGSLMLFWNLPSVLITVCGSFTALLIKFNFDQIKKVLVTTKMAFTTSPTERTELVERFSWLAKKARREGLLALEDEINEEEDLFFAKGMQMMVDAMEPELIREILETDISQTQRRHELGQDVFNTWALLAPAFGMIGTLIGLIQMLSKLDDPSALGPSMAVALLTTFYGALLANLIFIPIVGKLGLKSDEELLGKKIIIEGIIGIQSGMNPRILDEKLKAFLPPDARNAEGTQEGGPAINAAG
ncbi:motility protein A [Metallumcola ferriviriculae]|uniref:Motility protein A n=1 Tax=Metallumcola ferriviriculae TaxID=3039180 RepID=A0AAU0UTJ0_9FIRM|nr:motility protein A [Desulfitibacteraceae bacterium MK1]